LGIHLSPKGDKARGPAGVNDADLLVECRPGLTGSDIDQGFHAAAIVRVHRLQEGPERQRGGAINAQDFAESGRYPHEHRAGIE